MTSHHVWGRATINGKGRLGRSDPCFRRIGCLAETQVFRTDTHQFTCTQGSSKSPSLSHIRLLGIVKPGFWHPVIYPQLGYYYLSSYVMAVSALEHWFSQCPHSGSIPPSLADSLSLVLMCLCPRSLVNIKPANGFKKKSLQRAAMHTPISETALNQCSNSHIIVLRNPGVPQLNSIMYSTINMNQAILFANPLLRVVSIPG